MVPQKIPYFKHSFHHTKLRNYTGNDKTWVFRSALNSVIPTSENPFNSYDSNGVFLVFISSLGNEKRKLPISLFTCSFLVSPGHIWTYKYVIRKVLSKGIQRNWNHGKQCRWENGSMCIPPMETSLGHWNMSLLSQDKNPIIGRIFAGNPNIWFFRCLPNRDVISSLNPPNSYVPNGGTYVWIGGLLREK